MSRQPRRRARLLLFVAISITGLSTLASCGVSKDSVPRPIAQDKVPFSLLGPSTSKPGDGAGDAGTLVEVWFVSSQRLQAVTRTVADAQPRTVLDSLVKGVAVGDPDGLSSAIPQSTTIAAIEHDGTTLVVTLSSAIVSVTGPEQKNAFAQLTYTAMGLSGISGVRFRALDNNGQAQDLEPTTDTGNKQGPLTKADFNTLSPNR
ncbi:MAG: GerMN domain-containing protein [Acidimicrobiales bacterium]